MSAEITALLRRLRNGDRDALNLLTPMIYHELHAIARRQLRRDRPNHTLQPTALVNEAFLRIFGEEMPELQDRVHLLACAARVMREVLVDHARARKSKKRWGHLQLTTKPDFAAPTAEPIDVLAVDQALNRLGEESPELVQLVEMRFFAGMTAEETAEALGQSVHVVRHDLRYALARLRRQIVPNRTEE